MEREGVGEGVREGEMRKESEGEGEVRKESKGGGKERWPRSVH